MMKKKIIAVVLAVGMLVGSSVVAWGADANWNGSSYTDGNSDSVTNQKPVKVDFSVTEDTLYSVDITWGSLEYTYGAKRVWNPGNHNYTVDISGAGWSAKEPGTTDTIQVVNNSNSKIYGKYSFTADSDFKTNYSTTDVGATFAPTGTGVSLTSDKFEIETAVSKAVGDTTLQSNVKVSMSGTIGKDSTDTAVQVGNVTIELSNSEIS